MQLFHLFLALVDEEKLWREVFVRIWLGCLFGRVGARSSSSSSGGGSGVCLLAQLDVVLLDGQVPNAQLVVLARGGEHRRVDVVPLDARSSRSC